MSSTNWQHNNATATKNSLVVVAHGPCEHAHEQEFDASVEHVIWVIWIKEKGRHDEKGKTSSRNSFHELEALPIKLWAEFFFVLYKETLISQFWWARDDSVPSIWLQRFKNLMIPNSITFVQHIIASSLQKVLYEIPHWVLCHKYLCTKMMFITLSIAIASQQQNETDYSSWNLMDIKLLSLSNPTYSK